MYQIVIIILWVFLGLTFNALAMAAPPVLPDSKNLPRVKPQNLLPEIETPELTQPQQPAYQPAIAQDEALTITVSTFEFSGNQHFDGQRLSQLLAKFLDRPIGLLELNQATAIITEFYRSHGYLLAQAYLPQQDIVNNSVEIAVIEGALDKIKLKLSAGLDEEFLNAMANWGIAPGDPVREDNLIRNLFILNGLAGLNASSELFPGAAVGSSLVEIDAQAKKRWNLQLQFDNYGNQYTQREELQAAGTVNNLAGRGDQLNLNLTNSRDNGQRDLQLGYTIPVHPSGTLLGVNYNYMDYQLGAPFEALGATGKTNYFQISVDQPLWRTARRGLTGRIALSQNRVDDDVDTFSLKNRRTINGINLGLAGDWRDSSWGGINQAALIAKLGRVSFRDNFAESLDALGADTEGGFAKYSLLATRIQPITTSLNLTLHAQYQVPSRNLDPTEKLDIGGPNFWRAFGDLPTSVDRGLLLGVELRQHLASETLSKFLIDGVSPYGFVDYGHGALNQDALSSDNHVSSLHYGLGLDATIAKRWQLGFALSHEIRRIDGTPRENDTRGWGQIQASF